MHSNCADVIENIKNEFFVTKIRQIVEKWKNLRYNWQFKPTARDQQSISHVKITGSIIQPIVNTIKQASEKNFERAPTWEIQNTQPHTFSIFFLYQYFFKKRAKRTYKS